MIDLKYQMIRQLGHDEPILRWQVVFQTPMGWFEKLDDANTACAAVDLSPQLCVVPVVMAISQTMHEIR